MAHAGESEEVIQLVLGQRRDARPATVRRTLLHASRRQLTLRISSWLSRATRQLERAATRTSRVTGPRDPALQGGVPYTGLAESAYYARGAWGTPAAATAT